MMLFLSLWALGTGLLMPSIYAQNCENRCLGFDGNDDQIRASISPLFIPNTEFTLELWFLSDNPTTGVLNSPEYFHKLIVLSSPQLGSVPVKFGQQEDSLYYQIGLAPPVLISDNISIGSWNHLAVSYDLGIGQTVFYINGNPVLTNNFSLGYVYNDLTIGEVRGNSTVTASSLDGWKGQIDEFRVWDYGRTQAEIQSSLHCPCTGDEQELKVCWSFDQGIENDDNTTISQVDDKADFIGINQGNLNNFTLNGAVSNFTCSNAPLIYPFYENLELTINDYFVPTNVLTEICTGDPVRFCLSQNGNMPQLPEVIEPGTDVTANVIWQFSDDAGSTFTDIPTFQGFCFPVGPNVITADCAANSDGFVDRLFRVKIEVVENVDINDVCTYYSDPVNLRICCPISPATVDVTTDFPNDLLCAGDEVDFAITLNSPDDFVTTLGPDVTIEWCYNDTSINFSNQTTFNYNKIVYAPEACFSAKITNCGGKSASFKKCFTVDPIPTCGDIIAPHLNQISASPLTYEICPGEDTQLEMVNAADFSNGIITWEFRFESGTTWTPLGISNSIQNTNILSQDGPAGSLYQWPPMEDCIIYRVKVSPFFRSVGL